MLFTILTTLFLASSAMAVAIGERDASRTLSPRVSGGYARTCGGTDVQGFINSPQVNMNVQHCGNGHGGYNDATIDINGCINNNNGQLYAGGGGFGESCGNYQVSGSYLYAVCKNNQGGYSRTGIDLNADVGNINGRLVC